MVSYVSTILNGTYTDVTYFNSRDSNTLSKIGSTLYATVNRNNIGSIYSSTDDGSSWSLVTTLGATKLESAYSSQVGSPLLTYQQFADSFSGGDPTMYYTTSFSPFTLASVTTQTAAGIASINNFHSGGMAFCANGDQVVVQQSPASSVMGNSYERVEYRVRTGGSGSFGSGVVFCANDTVSYNYLGPYAHPGTNIVQLYWTRSSGGGGLWRRTLSGGSLGTIQTITSYVPSLLNWYSNFVSIGNTVYQVRLYNAGSGSGSLVLVSYDGTTTSSTESYEVIQSGLTTTSQPGQIQIAVAPDGSDDLYVFASGLVRTTGEALSFADCYMLIRSASSGTWNVGPLVKPPVVMTARTNYYLYPTGASAYTRSNGAPAIGITVLEYDNFSADYLHFYEHTFVGPPGTPSTAPSVAAGAEKVTVTTPALSTSTDASSWSVYRSGTLIASGVAGSTAIDDTGASVTSTQTYTVRGVNDSGTSGDSPASTAVAANPGSAVLAFDRTTPGQITVQVTKKSYDAVYRIYRGSHGGTRTLVHTSATVTGGTGTYSWVDSGTTDTAIYDYSNVVDVSAPTARSSTESSVYVASPNYWTAQTDSATVRHRSHGVAIGNYYYSMQGYSDGGATFNTNVLRYNLTTKVWDSYGSSSAYYFPGDGFVVNDVAYFITNQIENSVSVYRFAKFDPSVGATGTWSLTASQLPQSYESWRGVVVGTRIYMIYTQGSWYFYYYETANDTWTALSSIGGFGTKTHFYNENDKKIYAFHGSAWKAFDTTNHGAGWSDVSGSALPWSTNNEQTSSYGGPDLSYNGFGYVFGTANNQYPTLPSGNAEVWMLDLSDRSWTLIDNNIPNSQLYMAASRAGNSFFVFGGSTNSGSWVVNGRGRRYHVPQRPPSQDFIGSAALSGAGSLTGVAAAISTAGSAALAGAGTLTGVAPQSETGLVALAGSGALITVAAVELLPPTNLTATPISSTQIDLSWTAATSATGYDIERNGVVIVNNQPGTTYSDTGLTQGQAYTYRVRSIKVVVG